MRGVVQSGIIAAWLAHTHDTCTLILLKDDTLKPPYVDLIKRPHLNVLFLVF
uniref:Uncharacterized protein n=1 Tax=mine drainage metagenome TaxID=410659 RepID=E6QU17_9ZZZZ